MNEDTIINTLYFVLMAAGLWIAGAPFFHKASYPLFGQFLRGLFITMHFLILAVLIITAFQPRKDPQDVSMAYAWLYGVVGHAGLAILSLIVRFIEHLFKE
ncbi:hypothetical protein [Sphingobacterium gobiense]|uniref:Uncharacterized protein n=1 Tax=Sphingobacterium gobiense TaxID=1382456 RepID=A0A2S9JUY7_9SPHI|nr:hypothetical protein [Sphingobacterium gobiense]PRD57085.1 hypothetical protein C5749_07730 [Sphingobacterium gobiense]